VHEWAVVLAVALGASLLTLFSGFGLGTLLLPAFAWVFPLDVAVAATALVHLANNVWKAGLLGRLADRAVVLRLGVPAALAAFVGAFLLLHLDPTPFATWRYGEVSGMGLVIGGLIIAFALFDLVPRLKDWHLHSAHLGWGGALGGFFGGLSGHQGALRSVFLTKVGLDAKAFIATGTLCAILVDVSRLTVYGVATWRDAGLAIGTAGGWGLIGAACLMAFLGAWIGKRLMGKVTLDGVRTLVGILLLLTGSSLAAGLR